MSDRAVVRLALEGPQSLGDLRDFMATAVVLGMPDGATVDASLNTITLSTFLDNLDDPREAGDHA